MGLLLLVIATVTLVFGDPISDIPMLAPVCWDIRYASPAPKPIKVGIAGTRRALRRLFLENVLTGLGLGINSCLCSSSGGDTLIGDSLLLKTVFLNLSNELARAVLAGFLLNFVLLNCIGGVLGNFDFLTLLFANASENNILINKILKGNTILKKKCCIFTENLSLA